MGIAERIRNPWRANYKLKTEPISPDGLKFHPLKVTKPLFDVTYALKYFDNRINQAGVHRVGAFERRRIHRRAHRRTPEPIDNTTTITAKKRRPGEAQGGSHASPIVHLRRGHPRNLPNGKRIWIKDCAIGGNAEDLAFADRHRESYRLKGAESKTPSKFKESIQPEMNHKWCAKTMQAHHIAARLLKQGTTV